MPAAMLYEDVQIMARINTTALDIYKAGGERDYWSFRLASEFGKDLNAKKPVVAYYMACIDSAVKYGDSDTLAY